MGFLFRCLAVASGLMCAGFAHAAPCIDHIPSVTICGDVAATRVPLDNEEYDPEGRLNFSLLLLRDLGTAIIGVSWADSPSYIADDPVLAFAPDDYVASFADVFKLTQLDEPDKQLLGKDEIGHAVVNGNHMWAGLETYLGTKGELAGRKLFVVSVALADSEKGVHILFVLHNAQADVNAILGQLTFNEIVLADALR